MKLTYIAILIFTLSYGVLEYMTNSNREKSADAIIQKHLNNPGLKHSLIKINNKTTISKKKAAKDYIIIFYLTNIVAIPNYCKNKGIIMSSYKEVMKKSQSKLYTMSKNILGWDDVSVNQTYSKYRAILMKGAEYKIKEASIHNKMTDKETCKFFSTASNFIANHYDFSLEYPEKYDALIKNNLTLTR